MRSVGESRPNSALATRSEVFARRRPPALSVS
jgi:hypothetical protein